MLKYGIDRIDDYPALFRGRRLGLITSVSGATSGLLSTIDVLHERYGLQALFSPEHGVRGNLNAGQHVGAHTDEATGLPVYSLYSEHSKRLTAEMLSGIDTVVYDIQDIGAVTIPLFLLCFMRWRTAQSTAKNWLYWTGQTRWETALRAIF